MTSPAVGAQGKNSTYEVYDAEGKLVMSLPDKGRNVRAATFSPDLAWAVGGDENGVVRVWDLASRREVRSLEGHTSRITSATFSPDGRLVLTGGRDQTVRLFDLAGWVVSRD